MAAIITTRQPFGSVTEGRLRNLVNVKNKQNAIVATSAKSLKRVYESDSSASDNDNENVDPVFSPSKKAKASNGLAKPGNNFLVYAKSTSNLKTRTIATPKRLKVKTEQATPVSAPVGGRSPDRKRRGIGARRRADNSSLTRVQPPSFAKASSNGMPFSLDAALSDMVSSAPKKVTSDLKEGMPSRWDFVIYEDSPEEELSNLVQHSTQTLDISDDESKTLERNDRGKENVPPADCVARPVARSDIMTEEVRTPLGDLNASDYYAAGLDANSVDVIPGDTESTFTFEVQKKVGTSEIIKDFLSKVSEPTTTVEVKDLSKEIIKSEEPFQIYESGSDKES